MWTLACCDDDGRCFGFLAKDKSVVTDAEKVDDVDFCKRNLMTFRTKKESNAYALQVNLGHMLLPNGADFRVAPVRF